MSSTPIEGPPLPQRPSDQKNEVDADKFKRMMKVDESDETQKRHKRTKYEEEEEEEEVEDEKVPHTAFKELMGEPKKGAGLFDAKGGIKAELEAIGAPVETTRKATTPPVVPRVKTEEERKEKEEKEQRRAKKIETESAIAKTREKKEKEEIKPLEPVAPLTAVAVPTTPLTASTTPAPSQESTEETEVEPSVTAHIPVESFEEKEIAAPLPTPTTTTPQAPPVEEEKPIEVIPLKKKEKPVESEKKETETPPTTPPPILPISPIERTPAPSYTSLNSEMFDLFERLIGLMTIEQTKGVSTTTVTLNMPGSVFNGCQIVLEHYSTAPHAFNLELRGNPEAVQFFNDNLSDLSAAFQGSRLAFTINLRTPSLLEEHRPLIRRKEKPKEKQP